MSDDTFDARMTTAHIRPNGDKWLPEFMLYAHPQSELAFDDSVYVDIGARDPATQDILYTCSEVRMAPHENGDSGHRPLRLRRRALEEFMTQLWRMGLRPQNKPEVSDGEREVMTVLRGAKDEHISDLRGEVGFLRVLVSDRGKGATDE